MKVVYSIPREVKHRERIFNGTKAVMIDVVKYFVKAIRINIVSYRAAVVKASQRVELYEPAIFAADGQLIGSHQVRKSADAEIREEIRDGILIIISNSN